MRQNYDRDGRLICHKKFTQKSPEAKWVKSVRDVGSIFYPKLPGGKMGKRFL